jgi:hypothetical protein
MSHPNTVKDLNGEILTGRVWRKYQTFFGHLPFYTNVPRMEEIDVPMQSLECGYKDLLMVCQLSFISYANNLMI